jgi:N-formylglutamate deformylase
MEPFELTRGSQPLLVSMPHSGTYVAPDIEARLSEAGRLLADTDWHIPRLYDFIAGMEASVIRANHSRYVADLNRPPDGKPLYPGASNTELCPTSSFAEAPLYLEGQGPREEEIGARLEAVWRPYHTALAAELQAIRERHGIALLWDAHSIRSRVPRFFEGRLPDLNFGSAGGIAAAPGLTDILTAVGREAEVLGFTHVLDGRFKGGYITRHYGDPAGGIHAVQLELSQITYMDEDPPFTFRDDLAERIRPVLAGLLQTALAWADLEGPG